MHVVILILFPHLRLSLGLSFWNSLSPWKDFQDKYPPMTACSLSTHTNQSCSKHGKQWSRVKRKSLFLRKKEARRFFQTFLFGGSRLLSSSFFFFFLVKADLECGKKKWPRLCCVLPWRRERLPTPAFWPGEFHGLYSPWGHKELDMTEQLSQRV